MRTLIIIAGGLALLGPFALVGHRMGRGFRGVLPTSRYSVGEELPVFLLIVAIPVGTAWLLSRWLSPVSP